MKRTIVAIITGAALLILPAFAQDTPVIDQRKQNEKERIKAGVKDGSLTKAEAAKLKAKEGKINKDIRRAEKDGVVTGKEKAKIAKEQNKLSKNIAKQRKDKQKQKDKQ